MYSIFSPVDSQCASLRDSLVQMKNAKMQCEESFEESSSSECMGHLPETNGNQYWSNSSLIDFGILANNLQHLYTKMVENKNNLIKHYGEEFESRYVMNARDFARELILDAS